MIQIPQEIQDLLKKPVAILGFGLSGLAVKKLLDKIGCDCKVYDEKCISVGVSNLFDVNQAKSHKLVVCSPGFSTKHKWVQIARKHCKCIYGEMDFASFFWRGELIGITGTNGKTTLSSFLAMAFERKGIRTVLAGNIGIPLSQIVADDNGENSWLICEVSSFQAQTLTSMRFTHVLWTNFAEDHLDYHTSMDEYFESKLNLLKSSQQTSYIGESVAKYAEMNNFCLPKNTKVVNLELEIAEKISKESPFSRLPQRKNYRMALEFWRELGHLDEDLNHAADLFKLANHRLQLLGTYQNLRFWNDSKATNFDAVIQGLKGFNKPVAWLGGGKDKKGNLDRFVEEIKDQVAYACLIGETKDALNDALSSKSVPCEVFENLNCAISHLISLELDFEDIVFSPGFSSFDMFENYEHRGNSFIKVFFGLKNPSNLSIFK